MRRRAIRAIRSLSQQNNHNITRISRNMSSKVSGIGHSGHLSTDQLRNRHDAPAVDASLGLTANEKYLFDLNGFLVLRNVLSPEMIADANTAIDKHEATELHERSGELRTSALYVIVRGLIVYLICFEDYFSVLFLSYSISSGALGIPDFTVSCSIIA